jgi:hypothetical protein
MPKYSRRGHSILLYSFRTPIITQVDAARVQYAAVS